MHIKIKLLISFTFCSLLFYSQQVSAVYKIGDLNKRISHKDTIYVVNFWATWCKPCVEELPNFDSLTKVFKKTNSKVLLVCLDFKEELSKKVNPFLRSKKIETECVLLDEVNGNDFINVIDKSWSGAIPATYIVNNQKKLFIEKKLSFDELILNWKKIAAN